jgi:hypothetical protein
LTNFSNGKQTQESLESDFPEINFRKTNTAKKENIFLETKPNFSLTGKCFPLINFPNGKQTHESLENSFPESEFQETNMTLTCLQRTSLKWIRDSKLSLLLLLLLLLMRCATMKILLAIHARSRKSQIDVSNFFQKLHSLPSVFIQLN